VRLAIPGLLALLAACTTAPDSHVPAFAKKPYEPISRDTVVAIALREWRLFGSRIDDDPPGTPRPAGRKEEREPGLWQRVGEYWWLSQDAGQREAGWTGRHDDFGAVFTSETDDKYAWSAAFISYVMRIGGAGRRFPYAASHWVYINAAVQGSNGLFTAERPERATPRSGDLVCTGRGSDAGLHYADLPAGPFLSHCDIVVAVSSGQLSAVGGNVDDAVTMKHVPVTPEGRLAMSDGTVLDTRYNWMVVLSMREGDW